jgi:hypothetical protein
VHAARGGDPDEGAELVSLQDARAQRERRATSNRD